MNTQHYCTRCLNAPVDLPKTLCAECVALLAKLRAERDAAAAKAPRYGYRRGSGKGTW